MRVLMGFQDAVPAGLDAARYEVCCVRYGRNGGPPTTIAEMQALCPPGWKPDVYYHASLGYFPIPTDIETFDGLTVAGVSDWDRGGRAIWNGAGFFDLIVSEQNACALLQAAGHENALFARFWGVGADLHRVLPDVQKDIDVLFVGALNPGVWGERNRWLDRLARLSDKYWIVIASGHHGEDYVRLLNRAKIVFNRSNRGETNQRAYEAAACGALVFNEVENAEAQEIFVDRVHCVYYSADNFEALLDYYLAHAEERARIAEAGRQRAVGEHTHEQHNAALFALIEANLDKAGYRPSAQLPPTERQIRKAFQIYGSAEPGAAMTALLLLNEAERSGYDPGRLAEARAALYGWMAYCLPPEHKAKYFTGAIRQARQAVERLPENALARMGFGFLLLDRAEATGGAPPTAPNDISEAAAHLVVAAEQCEAGTAEVDGFGYPRRSDLWDAHIGRLWMQHRMEEERWAREMRAAIAWRCRSLVSDLLLANGRQAEAYRQAEAAVRAWPMEAEAQLRLARIAARLGNRGEAINAYRASLAESPFQCDAWLELAEALVSAGRRAEAKAFVRERLRVVQAIPSLAAIRPALMTVFK